MKEKLALATGLILAIACSVALIISVNANSAKQTHKLNKTAAAVVQAKRTSHEICVAVNNLNHVITAQIKRSQRITPRFDYYKRHPKELRLVQVELTKELYAFRPRHCL